MTEPKEKSSADKSLHRIRVGLAGWSYDDWSGIVYPSPQPRGFHELTFLVQYFDTIELNTSFYQPPKSSLATHWLGLAAENPGFVFTAKMSRKFTHEEDATVEDEKLVRAGFDPLFEAGKLGAVLLQFPFSFHHSSESLFRLKELIHRFREYPLVVEVRHSSWARPDFYELLHDRGVGFCNIDQPVIGKSMKPTGHATSPVGYFRLHGRRYDTWFTDDPEVPSHERYNYLYSEEELEPWAKRVGHVADHVENTFVIGNNHYIGKAAVNALQLIHLLRGAKVKVPEPLRQHYPHLDLIASGPAKEPLLFPLPPE